MATVTIGERTYEVEVRGETVVVDGHDIPVKLRHDDPTGLAIAGGVQYRVKLPPEEERTSGMEVEVDYRPFTISWEGSLGGASAPRSRRTSSPTASSTAAAAGAPVKGGIAAQISGRVVAVKVAAGDTVEAGQVVLLLEAMKMENEIKAPAAGIVKELRVVEGQRVAEGEVMVVIE